MLSHSYVEYLRTNVFLFSRNPLGHWIDIKNVVVIIKNTNVSLVKYAPTLHKFHRSYMFFTADEFRW